MTHYDAADTVVDALTNDALNGQGLYRGAAAEALLRLPAEYRQACELEVRRRSTRVLESHERDGLFDYMAIADPDSTRRAVVEEILAQIAR